MTIFRSFLRERSIPSNAIALTCVIVFLVHLFLDKALQSGTVAHCRYALAVPLKLQYKVDLNNHTVATLLHATSLQHPRVPVAAPVWSHNKVLTYMDNLPMRLNVECLLQKSAFLLRLATGWGISKPLAGVMDSVFCNILGDSTLLIGPHPSSLYENEST